MNNFPRFLLAASVSLLASTSFADNFNYNYGQVGINLSKTEFKFPGIRPDFSGRGVNAMLQFSPVNGFYVKGMISRDAINKSRAKGPQRVKVDGTITTAGALAGVIVPLGDGVDLRGGLGLARVQRDYRSTLTLLPKNKTTASKLGKTEVGFYGEAGLKFDLQDWGDLDLLYSRINKANFFTIGGNTPITENLGVELGYTLSPKGPDRNRYGAWNLGVRYYY